MKAAIGNKVKVINQNFEGIIKTILENNQLIITCPDGFDYTLSINEVVIIADDNTHQYTIDKTIVSSKITSEKYNTDDFLNQYTSKSKFQINRTLEVDLHLNKLVEHPDKLDDWHCLLKQMQHVKNCLSAAKKQNISKIVFIHGVGTGVLKTELQNYLSKDKNYTVNKADISEYGNGAIHVLIKN